MKVFFILAVLVLTAVAIRKDGGTAFVVTDEQGNLEGNHSGHLLGLQRVEDGADLYLGVTDGEGDITFQVASGGVVALFLDYDGCSDFLNPLLGDDHAVSPGYFRKFKKHDLYLHERAKFIAWLKRKTAGADRVILFVGSNRQSISIDRKIESNPGGFAAIENGGFEAIAQTIGTEVSGRPWEMNYALVADLHGDRPFMASGAQSRQFKEGGAWTDPSLKCTEEFMNQRLPRDRRKSAERDLKWMMVMNNMKQLKNMKQPVTVYFIDDKQEFLTHTAQQFRQEVATGFKNWGEGYRHISFKTVKWDYMDYVIDGKDAPIRTTDVN
jgi:hypothetical protein